MVHNISNLHNFTNKKCSSAISKLHFMACNEINCSTATHARATSQHCEFDPDQLTSVGYYAARTKQCSVVMLVTFLKENTRTNRLFI